MILRLRVALLLAVVPTVALGQVSLREKIGQMVMVTVTGDSVEETSPSMDTLKSNLTEGLVGGLVMFVWSGNLQSPGQIGHLTGELQKLSRIPLLLAIDQEGGNVARLSASNGFAATPTAYSLGTTVNQESYTRSVASTMAGWFQQTGLNMNLAPVLDVNVNPTSPAIGALARSFSADSSGVANHAGWFVDEFRSRGIITTLKHFPGHGSAESDSHLGFTDVTATWSPMELHPYAALLNDQVVDAVMTGHLFNSTIDSTYPATLSQATISGLLRGELGYNGVVVSDAMSMKAISSIFGGEEAVELAVNAGMDILLYTRNLDSTGKSVARWIVDLVERRVQEGGIPETRIDESYSRIMALKGRYLTDVKQPVIAPLPEHISLVAYPNPFNPVTTLKFAIGGIRDQGLGARNVKLVIYDLLGREVAVLVDEHKSAGTYSVKFDARGLASGVYFCRLTVGGGQAASQPESIRTEKLMLLR